MNLFGLTLFEVQKFLIVFVRLAAILVVIPFYGERAVLPHLRLALAFFLAIVVTPLVSDATFVEYSTFLGFTIAFLQSMLAGLLIGFIPMLLFTGIQVGGELRGFQMGFGIVSVMDPLSQNRMSLIAQFDYIIAFLILISLNGHLYFLQGIVKSFQFIPLAGASFQGLIGKQLIILSGKMFVIGVKIAAPILVAIMLTNVGLGILARTMPQMNIFIVGFPLQIGIGLITLGMSVPIFAYVFEKLFFQTYKDWLAIISHL
jgi:flagellar biosynthetic protein FliR